MLTAFPMNVALSWADNSSDETSFEIERAVSVDEPVYENVGIVSAGVTTFTDINVPFGVTLLYRVRAVTDGAASEWSNIASVTIPPPPAAAVGRTSVTGNLNLIFSPP